MTSPRFLLISGVALCAAGIVYYLDSALDNFAPLKNPGIGALVPMLGLLGFPGFWLSLNRRNDGLALVAYTLGMLGLAGLVALTFIVNLQLPGLPPETRGIALAAVGPEFKLIGITFLASAALVCAIIWKAGPLMRISGILYLLGAVIVGLRPFVPPVLHVLDGPLIGTALLLWGYHILSRRGQITPVSDMAI